MRPLERVEVPGYPFAIAAARGAVWAEVLLETDTDRRFEIMRLDDRRWRSTGWSGSSGEVRLWSRAGATWVRCGTVVRCLDDETVALDVAAGVEPDEQIHAVRIVDGDAILVCARPRQHTTVRAVDRHGRLRWSRPLLAGPDVLGQTHGRPAELVPSYSFELEATAGLAVASVEDARSGIAVCFGVSLDDGAVCWSTRPGPISGLTVLEAGTIAIHRHGYGWFETSAWRREGEQTRWASDGRLVRLGDTWFAAEHTNCTSEPMHWARWNPDGTVIRGSRLPGYYMTGPIAVDGRAYFARRNELWCARADLTARPVVGFPDHVADRDPLWHGAALGDDGTLYLVRSSRNGPCEIWLARP